MHNRRNFLKKLSGQSNETPALPRRDFLKNSALLGGAVLLSDLPLAQAANSFVDDTIKVALIGCGGRGTGAALQALLSKQNVKRVDEAIVSVS